MISSFTICTVALFSSSPPTTPCAEYCGHCVGLWFHHEGKTCAEFEDYKRRGEDDIKSRLLIEGT